MIRINPCKMPIGYTNDMVKNKICKLLKVTYEEIVSFEIVKESLDARKKPQLIYSLIVDVVVKNEKKILKLNKSKEIQIISKKPFYFAYPCQNEIKKKIVIIGAGPAGLVCAYYLSKNGYPVLLLERGKKVEDRKIDVSDFWEGKPLLTNSNVQFGEGGAGTFSDGKLNTLIKDKEGRCREILSLFVEMGAPSDILYKQKPHVGTDLLEGMVRNLRNAIINFGGEIRFESQVTDFVIKQNEIEEIVINQSERIACDKVVLCIGHSARDTFECLQKIGISMQAKAFAVGLRVQHPQNLINESQYGIQTEDIYEQLGSASYKLTANPQKQRGVYSFCMCPGGYVVNASSEEGMLCINGMSYRNRDSHIANSAIIISVTPDDYPKEGPLSGVMFQRDLEKKAFAIGNGKIPTQSYGAFQKNELDVSINQELVRFKGDYQLANLRSLFTEEINQAFLEGMESFGHKIKGFDAKDVILAGVEARTSSPVRIIRDEHGEASIKGIYPCGEGAGYAGGITSAAMDGLYIATCVAKAYT